MKNRGPAVSASQSSCHERLLASDLAGFEAFGALAAVAAWR